MAKKEYWVLQQKLANDLSVDIQVVSNWVRRKKIASKYFDQFDRVMVNPETLTIKKLTLGNNGKWKVSEKTKK